MTKPPAPRVPAPGKPPAVARGIGPAPVRIALVALAVVYFVMLMKHPIPRGWIRPLAYFSECTGLFTQADPAATEYRLEGYSCERKTWELLDPRPYFPMRADDKEARFQRLGYFYAGDVKVLHALGDYVTAHHPAVDDGVSGPIGGIRMFQIRRPIPEPGTVIERYVYEPLAPVPAGAKRPLIFETAPATLRAQCTAVHAAPASGDLGGAGTDAVEVVPVGSDPWSQP